MERDRGGGAAGALTSRVALPSGGGSLRTIGETFATSPATGTAAITIPLPISPARGLEPEAVLRYGSGSGQSAFGLGWSLDVPQIRRRSERGVPRYGDDDVYVLDGDELVPGESHERDGFVVMRYRPRCERAYTRIERWSRGGDVAWRTISRDAITTWFGRDPAARIGEQQTFAWLAQGRWDLRGNAIRWDWVAEDGRGVQAVPHEATRSDAERAVNRYLRRICYGNRTPSAQGEALAMRDDWLFELVLDYGEEHLRDDGRASRTPRRPWTVRADPFSTSRAGFEVRTYRLCRQALLFHRMPEQLGRDATLVQAALLHYDETPIASYLTRVERIGFVDGRGVAAPAIELDYVRPRIDGEVRELALDGIPAGPSHASLIDLDGDGVPGLLVETPDAWWYRRGRGPVEVGFDPIERIERLPAFARGPHALLDLDGDGRLELACMSKTAGSHARTPEGWGAFRAFDSAVSTTESAKLVDLTGDGLTDLLVPTADGFYWHPARGLAGFGPPQLGDGPRVIASGAGELVAFADMTGDGLADIVRIRNGDVCYWPSRGHGRFGQPITMSNAPWFDAPDRFDPRRLRLADIDGSGPTDLVYAGREQVTVHANAAGNAWLPPATLAIAGFDDTTHVGIADLHGRGTACLVWSSPLPSGLRLAWVDLMPDGKPHLLVAMRNGLGGETAIRYAPSTRFAVGDRLAGRPWKTRLPFPVHVVERYEQLDRITGDRYTTRYAYHHGCYDGVERELAGFAMVEQWDRDDHDQLEQFHAPPALVRSWFHIGVAIDDAGDALAPFAGDLYGERRGTIEGDLGPRALRALRGALLHREVYALDDSPRSGVPYAVTSHDHAIAQLAPDVFAARQVTTLALEYERTEDPRVREERTLAFDAWGNPLREVAIAYGRAAPDLDPRLVERDRNAQRRTWIVETTRRFTQAIDDADRYLTPLPAEVTRHELVDAPFGRLAPEQLDALSRRLLGRAVTRYRRDDLTGLLPLGFVEPCAIAGEQLELVLAPEHIAVLGDRLAPELRAAARYREDADGAWRPANTLWFTESATTAAEELAFARAHFFVPRREVDAFGGTTIVRFDELDLLPVEVIDALGNRTTAGERDAAGATTNGNDYRVLAPALVTDENRNRSQVAFDALGRVAAMAVGGKLGEAVGDRLDIPDVDLDATAWFADPSPEAAAALLGGASTRIVFDHDRARREGRAARTATIARDLDDRVVVEIAYVDGLGRPLQQRALIDPGRWHVTGWSVRDRKGEAVRTYEPFFAGSHDEELQAIRGVASTLLRDPLGRAIGTLHPDHTWTKIAFGPWKVEHWDASDTCALDPLADPDVGAHLRALPVGEILPTWREARLAGDADGVRAAQQAAAHAGTPSLDVLDALAHVTASIQHQRRDGVDSFVATRFELDIEGRTRRAWDAADRLVAEQTHDLAGEALHVRALDAGERISWRACDGTAIAVWTPRGHRLRYEYDLLRRVTALWIDDRLAERVEHGEAIGDAENHRGRVYRKLDGAGLVRVHSYDHRGRAIVVGRRLVTDAQTEPDWRAEPSLDNEELVERMQLDRFDRVIERIAPDGTRIATRHDRAGNAVELTASGRAILVSADYDAQGRCVRALHGNGAERRFELDPATQRLTRLSTTCSGVVVQDATYHYDASGNVVAIRDAAQADTFFRNAVVSADAEYTYDALYQLVEASGREHAGQADAAVAHPNDGAAMRRWVEQYNYDAVGNLARLAHQAGGTGYVREHVYEDGNRLARVGDEAFTYDASGNLASAPHLSAIAWDARERMIGSTRTDRTHYAYDTTGARVRKTTFTAARREERVYLGGFERYRAYAADGTIALERITLLLGGDGGRVACLERRTRGDDDSPALLDRYQYGDHLGSSALELDGTGDVISYEQYYPYGGSAYQGLSGRPGTKRYRFIGKERDEETGFYYVGARYYAPYLARWTACDPAGLAAGVNRYIYCANNPVRLVDLDGAQPVPPPTPQTLPPVPPPVRPPPLRLLPPQFARPPPAPPVPRIPPMELLRTAGRIAARAPSAVAGGARAAAPGVRAAAPYVLLLLAAAAANYYFPPKAEFALDPDPDDNRLTPFGRNGPAYEVWRPPIEAPAPEVEIVHLRIEVGTPKRPLVWKEAPPTDPDPTTRQAAKKPVTHDHHLYPQKYRSRFLEIGIDIDEHTIPVEEHEHLSTYHQEMEWNEEWEEFLYDEDGQRIPRTPEECQEKALDLLNDGRIDVSKLPHTKRFGE